VADRLVYLIAYMIKSKHLTMVSSQFLTYLSHFGSWMRHDMRYDDLLDVAAVLGLLWFKWMLLVPCPESVVDGRTVDCAISDGCVNLGRRHWTASETA